VFVCVCVAISLSLSHKSTTSEDCDDLKAPPIMLSEDERDVDVESDEDENGERSRQNSGNRDMSLDRRAHHSALERKRRDHIKDSFTGLRDAIPTMQGDKSSRAQILRKAAEYISFMRRKQSTNQQDIEDLRRQNSHLEKQIRVLEGAKQSGNYSSAADILEENGLNDDASTLVAPRNDYVVADGTAAAAETAEASGGGGGGSRVIAPGQSLLLTTSAAPHIQIAEQPPRKKMKP